jgi:methionine-rich copper-binding protein CopC
MRRFQNFPRPLAVAALIATATTLTATNAAAGRFHAKLVKSAPAALDTLSLSPKAISLWFSEKLELPLTRVKLATSAGVAVPLGAPMRDEKVVNAPIVSTINTPLSDGSYTISYSVAAKDGHPSKGTINFVVRSKR